MHKILHRKATQCVECYVSDKSQIRLLTIEQIQASREAVSNVALTRIGHSVCLLKV